MVKICSLDEIEEAWRLENIKKNYANYKFVARGSIPQEAGRINILSRHISDVFGNLGETMLTIGLTGVFPSTENRPLFDLVRRGLGSARHLGEAPVHIFSAAEAAELGAVLSQVLANCWDCLLASKAQPIVMEVSHDEMFDLYCDSESSMSQFMAAIEPMKLQGFRYWSL